ncbi:NADPH-dependent FMN reductase [Polycladidibacter hongkongensis]|uniref:NADPH-dependent FMN reductase n=1 Tax=Polycladidibacter hongkongensis TaxID=1647556 RepID=UPI00082F33EB|nr:NAD(P)H-dependent oxidoreductase [Pseudovibrio hongkongensis]
MNTAKILVISGSTRTQSYNTQLAALMVKLAAQKGAEVTHLNLVDYPLPLYNGDLEAEEGLPKAALQLHAHFQANHGVFIASPEYNASFTPLLKNTLDWVSRHRPDGKSVFSTGVYAIGAVSPGALGGMRGLIQLRSVLEVGLGALVLPEMVSVGGAASAFDVHGNLASASVGARAQALVDRLYKEAQYQALA